MRPEGRPNLPSSSRRAPVRPRAGPVPGGPERRQHPGAAPARQRAPRNPEAGHVPPGARVPAGPGLVTAQGGVRACGRPARGKSPGEPRRCREGLRVTAPRAHSAQASLRHAHLGPLADGVLPGGSNAEGPRGRGRRPLASRPASARRVRARLKARGSHWLHLLRQARRAGGGACARGPAPGGQRLGSGPASTCDARRPSLGSGGSERGPGRRGGARGTERSWGRRQATVRFLLSSSWEALEPSGRVPVLPFGAAATVRDCDERATRWEPSNAQPGPG